MRCEACTEACTTSGSGQGIPSEWHVPLVLVERRGSWYGQGTWRALSLFTVAPSRASAICRLQSARVAAAPSSPSRFEKRAVFTAPPWLLFRSNSRIDVWLSSISAAHAASWASTSWRRSTWLSAPVLPVVLEPRQSRNLGEVRSTGTCMLRSRLGRCMLPVGRSGCMAMHGASRAEGERRTRTK